MGACGFIFVLATMLLNPCIMIKRIQKHASLKCDSFVSVEKHMNESCNIYFPNQVICSFQSKVEDIILGKIKKRKRAIKKKRKKVLGIVQCHC